MIICSCNVLSDHEIRAACASGECRLRSVSEVYRTLGGCSGQCHRCARSIRDVLDEIKHEDCATCAGGVCPHVVLEAAE